MTPRAAKLRHAVLPPLIAFVVAVLVFLPILRHGFVEWDDHLTLRDNPSWNPPAAQNIAEYWRHGHLQLWIPLTYTVWGILAPLAWDGQRLSATPFHATSILGHALAAAGVAILIRVLFHRAGRSQSQLADSPLVGNETGTNVSLAATLVGVAFAVHPVQVDAIAWASGLKDVLAGMFCVYAVLAWVWAFQRVVETEPDAAPQAGDKFPRRRAIGIAVAAALFALAMLSKPSAMALPLVAVPLGRLILGTNWKAVVWTVLVGCLMALPIAWIARDVQPPGEGIPPAIWVRPFLAADSVGFYLRHVLWPWPLAVDYGRVPRLPTAALALVPLALVAWIVTRVDRRAAGGLAIALILLLPVLGFLPFQFQRYSYVADHYLYAPMIGVCIAMGAVLARLLSPGAARHVALAVTGCWLLALAAMTMSYIPVWQDTMTLFEHNERAVPGSFAAQRILGFQASRGGDVESAERHYRAALALRADDSESAFNLANLLMRRGDVVLAEPLYRRVVELRPDFADGWRYLALSLEAQGKIAEAAEIRARISR